VLTEVPLQATAFQTGAFPDQDGFTAVSIP
jgi:hypothetical protein